MSDQPFWGELVYKRGVGPRPIYQKRLSAAALGKKIRGEDGVGNAVRLFQQYVP